MHRSLSAIKKLCPLHAVSNSLYKYARLFFFQEVTKPYTFIIFIVFLTAFLIFTYFMVPETKNKTFEEIANQFAPGGTVEVEEMVEEDGEMLDDADDSLPTLPNSYEEDHALVTLNFKDDKSAPASEKKINDPDT